MDTLPEIARELHVDAVVEGSVERSGDQVRITAQLIEAPSDRHVWAKSYERDLRDVLHLQDEVAQAIASEIRVKLTPQERVLASARQVNPEVYELYLKGRYFWNRRTKLDLKKGLECFQQALEKDPVYAPAYVGLADSYLALASYWVVPQDVAFPMAKAAALKALQIEDVSAEAHASLAEIAVENEWNFDGAEREFQKALALNPSYSVAHQWYAQGVLAPLGRLDEAHREMALAQQFDPSSAVVRMAMGFILIYARQYDRAIEQERNAIELDANFPRSHYFLGLAYEQKGVYAEAIKEFQTANALDPSPSYATSLAHAQALAGRKLEASNQLKYQ